jgi:chemotaxis protein CheZ
MAEAAVADSDAARLVAIGGRCSEPDPEIAAAGVRAMHEPMREALSAHETSLLAEVKALGQTIASAKAEIAALHVEDITVSHIPFATDELDAIVEHTAAATHAILASCEVLDRVAAALNGEVAGKLTEATTRIYEACGFQDITGQRITKVVAALKAIEAKVEQIVSTFDINSERMATHAPVAAGDDVALLNGPQLAAAAMDQSDIDRLLASFD